MRRGSHTSEQGRGCGRQVSPQAPPPVPLIGWGRTCRWQLWNRTALNFLHPRLQFGGLGPALGDFLASYSTFVRILAELCCGPRRLGVTKDFTPFRFLLCFVSLFFFCEFRFSFHISNEIVCIALAIIIGFLVASGSLGRPPLAPSQPQVQRRARHSHLFLV